MKERINYLSKVCKISTLPLKIVCSVLNLFPMELMFTCSIFSLLGFAYFLTLHYYLFNDISQSIVSYAKCGIIRYFKVTYTAPKGPGLLWDHPFSTYAKLSEKLTFLTSWYAHVCTCARTYVCVSGVRNVSFSESFAYLLNGWTLLSKPLFATHLDTVRSRSDF